MTTPTLRQLATECEQCQELARHFTGVPVSDLVVCSVHADYARAAADPSWRRTCEHCGVLLPLGWMAVYCSTQCALDDA